MQEQVIPEFADGKRIEAMFGLKRTIRFQLLREQKIKGKKVGASLLINVQSVREFLDAQPAAKGRAA
jgi:hypothetical protein